MSNKPNLYADLGVARDADEATIRRAYRRAAKHAHPDVEGGSREAWARISRALLVLTNAKSRAHYDKTGEADEPGPDQSFSQIHVAAGQAIFTAMQQVGSVDTSDVLAAAREVLRQQTNACKGAINQIKGVIEKIEKVERRLKRKRGRKEDDIIRQMLVGQIDMLRRTISMNEDNIKTNTEALTVLAEYEYQFARPTQPEWNPFPFLQSRDTRPW